MVSKGPWATKQFNKFHFDGFRHGCEQRREGFGHVEGGPGSHAEDHSLLNRLGEEPPQRIVAIPLVVRGRAVAVLYADSAGLDSESINLEALETLVTVSGMAVEMLSVSRATPAPKKAAEETAAPVEQPQSSYEPSSEYVEPPASEVNRRTPARIRLKVINPNRCRSNLKHS